MKITDLYFRMTENLNGKSKWLEKIWIKHSFLSFYLIPSSSFLAFFLCPCQDLLPGCPRHKRRKKYCNAANQKRSRAAAEHRRKHCRISKWCHMQVLFCKHASALHRHLQSHYSSFVLLSIILHRSQQENVSCTLDLWKQLVAPEDASALPGQ